MEEPHYNNPRMWKGPVHGIELFNDFTYTLSYNSELSETVIDDPNFVIPCYNGETFQILLDKSKLLGYFSPFGQLERRVSWRKIEICLLNKISRKVIQS